MRFSHVGRVRGQAGVRAPISTPIARVRKHHHHEKSDRGTHGGNALRVQHMCLFTCWPWEVLSAFKETVPKNKHNGDTPANNNTHENTNKSKNRTTVRDAFDVRNAAVANPKTGGQRSQRGQRSERNYERAPIRNRQQAIRGRGRVRRVARRTLCGDEPGDSMAIVWKTARRRRF